jgi:hypothetical protein
MRLTRRGRVVVGALAALTLAGMMTVLEGLSVLLFH